MPFRRYRGSARLALLLVSASVACDSASEPQTVAVRFVLDAPLCSSQIAVRFYIDSQLVARDTFRVNLQPDHVVSADFPTTVGVHRIGASPEIGLLWPDTIVTLSAGETFVDTLPFYCS